MPLDLLLYPLGAVGPISREVHVYIFLRECLSINLAEYFNMNNQQVHNVIIYEWSVSLLVLSQYIIYYPRKFQ